MSDVTISNIEASFQSDQDWIGEVRMQLPRITVLAFRWFKESDVLRNAEGSGLAQSQGIWPRHVQLDVVQHRSFVRHFCHRSMSIKLQRSMITCTSRAACGASFDERQLRVDATFQRLVQIAES